MREFRALETKSVFLVYGLMALLSLGADLWANGSPTHVWKQGSASALFWTLGILLALTYLMATHIAVRLFPWARDLSTLLRNVLTPISYLQLFVLAILSGFIEEWFFRGILQNHFGVIVASLLFGLMHFIPNPRYWTWSLVALGMGLALGSLYHVSQNLILVAVIHSGINFVLLFRLNQQAESRPALR